VVSNRKFIIGDGKGLPALVLLLEGWVVVLSLEEAGEGVTQIIKGPFNYTLGLFSWEVQTTADFFDPLINGKTTGDTELLKVLMIWFFILIKLRLT